MKAEERSRLIDDLVEGELSEADFLRLEAEFSVDRAARKEYYHRLGLSAALRAEAEARSMAEEEGANVVSFRPWWQTRTFTAVASGLVTAVAAVFVMMFYVFRISSEVDGVDHLVETAPEEQRASGFAVLAGQIDAQWADGLTLSEGALVPGGQLALESGVAQLEFFSGVTLVAEAPVAFEVISSMEMEVLRGRVRAHVPEPAEGFRVRTAEGEVVDLGTEFALEVSAEGAEVHVLDGEVEWYSREEDGEPGRRLTEGQGVRALAGGGVTPALQANAADFIGPAELRERLTSSRSGRLRAWEERSQHLRGDPRVVAYYRPGAHEGRSLPNLSGNGVGGRGAVVAAAWTRDRWGRADGALDFSPTGSRVRVTVPGEYGSLTLLAWVRIHSLDRWYNSLFLTDGHEQFEPHWQIMDDGRMFFSVKKRDRWDRKKGERDKHIYYSPPFWRASLSGQWLMLATTYDIDEKMVRHYLNGAVLSEEAIPEEYLVETVRIGNASLANWGLPERDDPHFAVRNLNGSMDEFMLYSGALSASEIQSLYEDGKP